MNSPSSSEPGGFGTDLESLEALDTFSVDQIIAMLELNLSKVPPGRLFFAKSLCKQGKEKGTLSLLQLQWAKRLILMATGKTPDKKEAQPVGTNFKAVYDFLNAAKAHLKYPSIHLQLENGEPLYLYISGSSSKVPNTVNLTDGGSYGDNKWYGRVSKEGVWTKAALVDHAKEGMIFSLLQELAADPPAAVSKYGKLTGKCCFCHKTLTDEHSTAAGFGPDCAKHYGLYAQWKGLAGYKEKEPSKKPSSFDSSGAKNLFQKFMTAYEEKIEDGSVPDSDGMSVTLVPSSALPSAPSLSKPSLIMAPSDEDIAVMKKAAWVTAADAHLVKPQGAPLFQDELLNKIVDHITKDSPVVLSEKVVASEAPAEPTAKIKFLKERGTPKAKPEKKPAPPPEDDLYLF